MSKQSLKLIVLGGIVSSTLPLASMAEDKISLQVQQYQENDDRIEVKDAKFTLEHDFTMDHTLSVDIDWDGISGASPAWDSLTGASQTITSDTVTGASPCVDEGGNYYDRCRDTRKIAGIVGDGHKDLSEFAYKNTDISDIRRSVSVLHTYKTPKKRNELSVGASYSKESDFVNKGGSVEYLMHTDNTKNRSITVGASYMQNQVYDYLEDRWNDFSLINTQVGVTQVFDAKTVGKFNLYYGLEDGHLSNPYFNVVRKVNVSADAQDDPYFKYYLSRDSRPDKREAGGVSAQLAKKYGDNTSLQLAYRYYQDSWAVRSHTLEAKSYHNLGKKFRLAPGLRYYTQSEASFFKAHDAKDAIFDEHGYASADHRLGNYDSWTTQLGLEYFATPKMTWNIVAGHLSQSSGLDANWVNLGVQYKY